MPIIYQKNPSELIPQGNRTVSTFPSGLVRVDQSFIGRTDFESTHRQQFQIGDPFPNGNEPSIDGLSIFPAIQEKRLPDGFTEYIVSAYGRTNTTGFSYIVPGQKFSATYRWRFRYDDQTYYSQGIFRGYDTVTTRVIKENVYDEEIAIDLPLPDLVLDYAIRSIPTPPWYIINLSADLSIDVKDIKRTNYGKFTELTVLSGYNERNIAVIA